MGLSNLELYGSDGVDSYYAFNKGRTLFCMETLLCGKGALNCELENTFGTTVQKFEWPKKIEFDLAYYAPRVIGLTTSFCWNILL